MLFTSVVFTTFLVAVFSVALFCATGLSPATAGLVAGFAVAEAAGFVAVVALPVVADFVAVDLETVLVIVTGFAAGLVASGRKLDFFVVFTFDTVVLDTVDFGVGFFVTTVPLFCSVAPCAIETPPMFTPKNKVAIIINCNRFVFIVISLSVKYLNAHRLI